MANIVKIKEVRLFVAWTEDAGDCHACKKLLDNAGIKYELMHYGDESAHAANFAALSTWAFGPDFNMYTFTKFPLVIWKEFYDDYERFEQVAQSSAELAASTLIAHADKVV